MSELADFDKALVDAKAHALEVFPLESVGYVAGSMYHRLENKASKPNEEFVLGPEQEAQAFASGMQALVHSHPNGRQSPTVTDMEFQQRSSVPWAVVVLTPPRPSEAKPTVRETFWFGDQVPIADLLGRRWRHGVHDCYGLCRDWHRLNSKIVLQNYPRDDDWWMNPHMQPIDDIMAKGNYNTVPMSEITPGDVLMMCVGGRKHGRLRVDHLGVYTGDGLMMHHLTNRFSRQEPVSPWRGVTISCVRPRGMNDESADPAPAR